MFRTSRGHLRADILGIQILGKVIQMNQLDATMIY